MRATAIKKAAFAAALILLVAGCSIRERIPPDYGLTLPERYHRGGEAGHALERWWEGFGDERLNALMEEAFTNNLDLSMAVERYLYARAEAGVPRSETRPRLALGGSGGKTRRGVAGGIERSESYSLSARATFELDLWRKLSKRTEAARLKALASGEEVKALYIGISAELGELYFLAREQRAQLELTDRTIAAFADTLKRVERRYRAGIVPPIDVYQSRQSLASARAGRPLFASTLRRTEASIALIAGRFPFGDSSLSSLLPAPPEISAGAPASLLSSRPDIEAARLRVEAADRYAAAAVAELLPSFILTGEYGGASERLSELLESPNILWSLLINAAQPVLSGGRLRAEVDKSNAVLREALFAYQKALLSAFGDVEKALIKNRASTERIEALTQESAASEGALRLALDRYTEGLSDYLPVLEAQKRAFQSESDLLSSRRELISNRIELARALGGRWAEGALERRLDRESNKGGEAR